MGFLARLIGIGRLSRDRGVLADDQPDQGETPRLPRPVPTRGTPVPRRPHATPTTEQLGQVGGTAGTRSYRTPGGTPSTERIHNPSRPAR